MPEVEAMWKFIEWPYIMDSLLGKSVIPNHRFVMEKKEPIQLDKSYLNLIQCHIILTKTVLPEAY